MSARVAITAMSAHGALGGSLEAIAQSLARGDVGVRAPMSLEQRPAVESGAGEVPLHGGELDGASRAEALLRGAIDELLSPADLADMAARPARWGAVLGTTLAGMRHCGAGMRAEQGGDVAGADRAFARTSASAVLAHATRGLPLRGPTVSVSCACASALAAMAHGCTLLEAGDVDAVIVGGYDPISEFAYGGFAALQLVAAGPLSPFAADREGMKLGEGVALFVLRRTDDANAAGIATIASVEACAESSDAHHLTQPHPAGDGASRVLRAVHVGERVPALLIAHATGTPGNDGAEHAAYVSVLGDRLPSMPVVALKGRLGHPLGAAGALELAAVLACAARGFVPSSAGRGRDRAAFPELALLEGEPSPGSPAEIVALAAGFGGANAAVRVRRGSDSAGAGPSRVLRSACIRGFGAVSPAGLGMRALVDARAGFAGPFAESTLAPVLDRARTRRLALLPRLMIGAVRDLANRARISDGELREIPVIAANWCGAVDFTERYYRDLLQSGIDLANPMLFAESVPNIGSAQVSLAFGVRAPCISVIGRRTAGIEAMALACARIRTGAWDRAIVVAAEEASPIVERVLAQCVGESIPLASGAVACLVSVGDAQHPSVAVMGRSLPLDAAGAVRALRDALPPAAVQWTSGSAFDRRAAPGVAAVFAPEFGAATALASLGCVLSGRDAAGISHVLDCDPHGAAWALRVDGGLHASIPGLAE